MQETVSGSDFSLALFAKAIVLSAINLYPVMQLININNLLRKIL